MVEPVPVESIVARARREGLASVLGDKIAVIAAEVAADGGAAVAVAAADPGHELFEAIQDRRLALTADVQVLSGIERRWGFAVPGL